MIAVLALAAMVTFIACPESDSCCPLFQRFGVVLEHKALCLAEDIVVDQQTSKNKRNLSASDLVEIAILHFPAESKVYRDPSVCADITLGNQIFCQGQPNTEVISAPLCWLEGHTRLAFPSGRLSCVVNFQGKLGGLAGYKIFPNDLQNAEIRPDLSLAHFASDGNRIERSFSRGAGQPQAAPNQPSPEDCKHSLTQRYHQKPSGRVGSYLLSLQVTGVVLAGLLFLIGGAEIVHRVWETAFNAEIGIGSRNPRPWKAFTLYICGGFLMIGSVLGAMAWGAWWIG